MNLLIVDDEIVTTQVLEEQLDRELLSIDQIYVATILLWPEIFCKKIKWN